MAAVAALSFGIQRADANHRMLYVENHGTSRIVKVTLVFHSSDQTPANYEAALDLAPGKTQRVIMPDVVETEGGHSFDVSKVCDFATSVTFENGVTRERISNDVCHYPALVAEDDYLGNGKIPAAYASPAPVAAAKRTPSDEALFRGTELFEQGRLAEALPLLRKAVALNPSSEDARYYLGQTYYLQNKLTLALEQFDKGIALSSDFSAPLHELRAFLELGQHLDDSAVEDFAITDRLTHANHAYFVAMAALAARDGGKGAQAKSLLSECANGCKGTAFALQAVNYLNGLSAARDLLIAAANKYDRSAAHIIIGFTLLQHGDAAGARTHFNWILKSGWPLDAWRPVARARLSEMK